MKHIIKVDNIPWIALGSIEQKCSGITEEKFDGYTERFSAVTSHYELLGLLDSTVIVVDDSSKFRE